MKISAFTFIKNGEILGYPFVQSIKSVLPIVDEFVINVGESEDNTLAQIQSINNSKIRIIESKWNDQMKEKGYVYGQQKMIAHFNCCYDWAFYVEADEIYHEDDLIKIKSAMQENIMDSNVEALAFNFLHFYGNANSYLDSPGWYRSEARIIKNSIRTYSPDGLFWVVLDKNKNGRYPKAKIIDAFCYHYGWVRTEEEMNLKSSKVQKYWDKSPIHIDYSQMDQSIIKKFEGTHPKVVKRWLPKDVGLYEVDENYQLTKKQKKHQFMIKIEKLLGLELSKKHYQLIK
jgi:hypothetical protein